jgi:glutamine synthetase
MGPKEAIELATNSGAVMVDLKFIDLPGKWQHTSVPIECLEEDSFENGFGFDGSSIRGFQPINQSDMLLIPDAETAVMDPFTRHPTLSLQCTIQDTLTRQNYSRDPRHIARKAEAYLQSTGVADTSYFGPEAEFFVFDDVRFEAAANKSFYFIDSAEADWNTGKDERPNLSHKIRHKEGYFPCPPQDTLMDLRTDIVLMLRQVGLEVEVSHHEVATAGQGEIDMRFDRLLRMADRLMWFKYIVKNVARQHGKTATFMPKPIAGDNGNGMHVHQSIWKDGKPLFAGDHYAGCEAYHGFLRV